MKRRKLLGLGPVGYTIIEVLVFLSVSGALLVAAGALISGRQERTLFSDGINDMTLQLQDTLNDVSTGLYSTNGSVRCEATAGGEIAVQPSGGQQGTSTNCIFSGKLINFPANSYC